MKQAAIFLLSVWFFLGAFVLLCLSVLGYLPASNFVIDNLCQLRLLYVLLLIPTFLVSLLLRFLKTGIVCILALVLNAGAVVPLYCGGPANGDKTVGIVTINIWGARNHNYDQAVQYVRTTNPDLICLNEITKTWMQELKTRLPDYPYRFDEGISGGSAVFSRLPIEKQNPPDGPKVRRYGVRGVINIARQPVLLIAEHPPSPSKLSNWKNRNKEFERLISDVNQAKMPVVLIGDLNSTPWSPYFQNLRDGAQLVDSESGQGLQPSWSTRLCIPLVPIDHCLMSGGLCTKRRIVGPDLGSDHLPVYVELAMDSNKSSRARVAK